MVPIRDGGLLSIVSSDVLESGHEVNFGGIREPCEMASVWFLVYNVAWNREGRLSIAISHSNARHGSGESRLLI